jgi:hypothetical protein
MAQVSASEAVAMSVGKIEISTNDSDWTDISGYGFQITPSGGGRMTGEVYTHDGETGIPTAGKMEPYELECTGVYTEDTSAPFATIWTQYIAAGGGALYVRYSPKAGATGDDLFTSGVCVITACLPPATDPGSGDPKTFAFTVRTQSITKTTIA